MSLFATITGADWQKSLARARTERNPIRERVSFLVSQFLSAPLLRPADYPAGGSPVAPTVSITQGPSATVTRDEGSAVNPDHARRLQDPFSAEKPASAKCISSK